VQGILKEGSITSPESAPRRKSRRVGRPSRVEAFRGEVEGILEAEPSLPTVAIVALEVIPVGLAESGCVTTRR